MWSHQHNPTCTCTVMSSLSPPHQMKEAVRLSIFLDSYNETNMTSETGLVSCGCLFSFYIHSIDIHVHVHVQVYYMYK